MNRYEAKIRVGGSTTIVSVQAQTSMDAKHLIEAQYGGKDKVSFIGTIKTIYK